MCGGLGGWGEKSGSLSTRPHPRGTWPSLLLEDRECDPPDGGFMGFRTCVDLEVCPLALGPLPGVLATSFHFALHSRVGDELVETPTFQDR